MNIISIPLRKENIKAAKLILERIKRSHINDLCIKMVKNTSGISLNIYWGSGNIRTAQLGGMGLPAGDGGMTGLNVDIDSGFRMWPYRSQQDDMDQLEENVRKQFRYNPSYSPTLSDIEEARQPEQEKNIVARYIPNINVKNIDVYYNEHRKPVIKITTSSGKVFQSELNSLLGIDEDMAHRVMKDKNRFKISWKNNDKGAVLLLKSIFMPGDKRGTTEVNKGSAVPGFAYIDEEGRASLSMHPEFLDNREWISGGWSPSKPSFLSGYPYHPY